MNPTHSVRGDRDREALLNEAARLEASALSQVTDLPVRRHFMGASVATHDVGSVQTLVESLGKIADRLQASSPGDLDTFISLRRNSPALKSLRSPFAAELVIEAAWHSPPRVSTMSRSEKEDLLSDTERSWEYEGLDVGAIKST